MFEVLQDVRLNKHLFYEVFLSLMDYIIPEIKAGKNEELGRAGSVSPLIVSSSELSMEKSKS